MDGAELQTDTINARLEDGFLDATALMEYLIRKGVPMRTGHETVGSLVTTCEQNGKRLAELTLAELQGVCDLIEDDVFDILGAKNAMAALCSYGSGGSDPVEHQLKIWQERLA